ncbi:hypothetical protein AAVH_11371 [Aphelenchoides avenae]|nr:hypothetical protein AAVH_11371 [Aphelenchus avenae]
MTKKIDWEWRLVGELYFTLRLQKFAPTPDYLLSKEFELTLRNGSLDDAVRLIFEGGCPTKYWLRIPDGLAPKIVEHFLALTDEPNMLPFTFISQAGWRPGAFWPEVYVTRFPCPTCADIVSVENDDYGGVPAEHLPACIRDQLEQESKLTKKYTVEKYHIRNDRFARTLTLEFHFTHCLYAGSRADYEDRPSKADLKKIVACLAEPRCLPSPKLRAPATKLRRPQLPVIINEVFAFNSRYRLEVCRLVCIKWKEVVDRGTSSEVRHDAQRLLHWSMLPALENCSIGHLRLNTKCEDLGRIRPAVEDVFVKRKVRQWTTGMKESMLQTLIEQYALLHWPVLQTLTELYITLQADRAEPMNPFWTNALLHLPNCKKLTISYCTADGADFRPVCRALVDVVEAFESDNISNVAVDRFVFNPGHTVVFPINYRQPAYREVRIRNTKLEREYVWDVYHFQNARTMAWLTMLVGHSLNRFPEEVPLTTLHIKKGKFTPSDSFL